MEPIKEIKLDDVVKYLNRAFFKASMKSAGTIGAKALRVKTKSGAWQPTKMYNYQIEFCYLLNDIMHGPRYISTKSIQRANELIARLDAESISK